MEAAFTMDDLPKWPHSDYPDGYSAEGIAQAIVDGMAQNGIEGAFAFCNSWSLLEQPGLSSVLDQWVAAGHHVGNHTHGHPNLNDVEAVDYIEQIDLADQHLAPWISQAPGRYFRYTLNMWGNTEEKLNQVRHHLEARNYRIAEVTSFFYEWRYNAAFEKCLARGDQEGIEFLKASFIDFSVAQLRYDMATAAEWFGGEVKGITLGHNVPFFADVAADLFAALKDAGLRFIPFEEAAADPVYDQAASTVCEKFLVLQQKLARVADRPITRISGDVSELYGRMEDMARA